MARYVIRLSRWTDYGDGNIQIKSFLCREGHDGVSMHLYDGELEADNALAYWNYAWLGSGDKPGICLLDDEDFVAIGQPVPTEDKDDKMAFGHIHYIWRPCPDDATAAKLARRAAERAGREGLVRELLSVKKGVKQFKQDP